MNSKKSSLKDLIYKNISFESEESQFLLMMRFYYIITALYIVAFYIFAAIAGILKEAPVLLIWLPLHVACFFTTYSCGRRLVFHIFSGGILTWLIYSVYLMGEDYGAHYFIYPLMVISFFATYRNFKGKAVYMIFLLALNIAVYFYGKGHEPILIITEQQGNVLNIMYTVTLFVCMFVICFIFSNTNQSALEKLNIYNRNLKKEAETDALTGLMNRRCMYKALEENMGVTDTVFSVAIGDIDLFKKINDTKGHNFGDEVLKQLADYLMKYMDEKGIVCRWGGEEFLFLFPSCNIDTAYSYVLEMREHIEKMPITVDGDTITVTMTFGVEEHKAEALVTELISKADTKLYDGKSGGRNTVVK
ncbi:MAG: GGDEF domain-containing protein [Oscillospiraceae bacterium]|nr:GGDEF domain-containing protein [Oscillospiraceae bacterium]